MITKFMAVEFGGSCAAVCAGNERHVRIPLLFQHTLRGLTVHICVPNNQHACMMFDGVRDMQIRFDWARYEMFVTEAPIDWNIKMIKFMELAVLSPRNPRLFFFFVSC